MRKGQFHITFRIAIVGAIIGIVTIMAILTSLIVYSRGETDATANARALFDENTKQVQERLNNRLSALTRLANLGVTIPGLDTPPSGFGMDHPLMGFLFGILETEHSVYGAYAGWSNGDFLELINASGDRRILDAHQAPPGCRAIVRAISGQGASRAQRWSYLDAEGRLLSQRTERLPPYDPRNRDWYRIASLDRRTHVGKAYVFNSLKEPGITASRSFGAGVFGVDMTLTDLQGFLNEASPSKRGGIILLEDGRRLLAASTGAAAWLPANVPALGDVGDSPAVAADAAWANVGGKAFLRQRSDWEWGADTRITLIVMAPLADFTAFFDSIRLTLTLLALAVLLVVSPMALWISRQLSRPLSTIARDAERVSAMDFSGQFAKGSWIVEIDHLSAGYSKMKYAINANRTLIEAQRDSYARFVPERMLELFDKSSVTEVQPCDCKALELTVMFSDIRSYTAISEGLSCDAVFGLLNEYFAITNPIIGQNDGIIDKYIGDAILSVFPISPDGALRAVIAINRELRAFNEERRKRAEPEILTGTGIHFGKVDLGTVGDLTRLQATVIGDAVNVASRLESATKAFGVRILMSEAARERLENPNAFRLRPIDTVRVKGKERPIRLYEVFDLDDTAVIERKAESGAIFSEAIRRYEAGDFTRALDLFEGCAAHCPEDTVAKAYIKRCSTLIRVPPGNDWAGVSTL
jgi:class 3 adenylate cyclase/HAMP domain-containing protein